MVFCLDDGARLIDRETADEQATLNLPSDATINPTEFARPKAPPTTPSPQATITARPEPFHLPQSHSAAATESEQSGKNVLPWIFAIVLVLGLSGILIAWMVTRSRDDQAQNRGGQPTPVVSPGVSPEASVQTSPEQTPSTSPDRKIEITSTPPPPPKSTPAPTPVPTKERPKLAFTVLNNTSFNGSRITYYPRPSFGACQADCSANASCRGFTWIRPGAYNPGDSAMCYLMSAVTARVPHACCISGVRN